MLDVSLQSNTLLEFFLGNEKRYHQPKISIKIVTTPTDAYFIKRWYATEICDLKVDDSGNFMANFWSENTTLDESTHPNADGDDLKKREKVKDRCT